MRTTVSITLLFNIDLYSNIQLLFIGKLWRFFNFIAKVPEHKINYNSTCAIDLQLNDMVVAVGIQLTGQSGISLCDFII